MPLTRDERQTLDDINKTMAELGTVLLGVDGAPGLVHRVGDLCDEMKALHSRHDRLARNFWLLVGVLAGSGVIGGSLYGLLT